MAIPLANSTTEQAVVLCGIPRRNAMNMTTSIRQAGGITIVDISGRIVLGEESAALRDLVRDLLSKEHRQILFNLAEVNYIDSAGLGSLVAAFTSVRKQKGELKLLNLTNKVHNVLQITKLYTVFDIMNDETEGVKSFGQSASATA
jgi:anti-sigma B factor antagonist